MRMKQLPRSVIDAFLQEFKVQRVRDLKQSDVDKALSFIEKAEAEHRSANQSGRSGSF